MHLKSGLIRETAFGGRGLIRRELLYIFFPYTFNHIYGVMVSMLALSVVGYHDFNKHDINILKMIFINDSGENTWVATYGDSSKLQGDLNN
jgi:hypothetical protein